MPIVPLFGHDALRARLSHAAARQSLPASLLFSGPRGVGKQRLALWLAQLLLCSNPSPSGACGTCQSCRYLSTLAHPDLHWVFPRPRLKDSDASPQEVRADYADARAERAAEHGLYAPSSGSEGLYVATIRAVVQSAAMAPAIGRRKVMVIGDAERMVPQEGSEQAANAFLKLLEEPPADTTIILTSSEPGGLLPTIRSRVVTLRAAPLSDQEVTAFLEHEAVRERLRADKVKESPQELVRIAGGAPGRLLGGEEWAAALNQAKKILEALTASDRGARYRAAFAQGASRARGSFSDTLDALTTLLHERARTAVARSDAHAALAASQAVALVEEAKETTERNVTPQLISAHLFNSLRTVLG